MKKEYFKNQTIRKHKVTTINLEKFQVEILKRKNLNASLIVRDLLGKFLESEYPELYNDLKSEAEND